MSITRSWPQVATVSQLRTAVKLEPPTPNPNPIHRARTAALDHQDHRRGVQLLADQTAARSRRPTFDAALQSHHDALIAEWKRDHDDRRRPRSRSAAAVADHR